MLGICSYHCSPIVSAVAAKAIVCIDLMHSVQVTRRGITQFGEIIVSGSGSKRGAFQGWLTAFEKEFVGISHYDQIMSRVAVVSVVVAEGAEKVKEVRYLFFRISLTFTRTEERIMHMSHYD